MNNNKELGMDGMTANVVETRWLIFWSRAVWHSCRMGARNQEQTRGRIGPQLRLGNLRVGELHFCPLCTALDQASSLSRKLAYVPGPTFGFVKLLASSGSHCTKWADEQHRQAGFESRLLPDLPLPVIPTLIGLRAFDLVSSRVWWEAATNIGTSRSEGCDTCAEGKSDTERRRLIATKIKEKARKNAIERTFEQQSAVIPKNKSDYYFLPWDSSFECFFSANSFLLDTTF